MIGMYTLIFNDNPEKPAISSYSSAEGDGRNGHGAHRARYCGPVQAAKTDPESADALIRQYTGFIRSETVKFIHTAPENGHEDELSIAMLAFYEAILSYESPRGAFLPYAARAIHNRLIDHYRREKRHGNVISLHTPLGQEEDGGQLLDTLPDTRDPMEEAAVREASEEEIRQFSEKLAEFGLTFSDVADNCPPSGADLCRLPPGAGFRPLPARSAPTGRGHWTASHDRSGRGNQRGAQDPGAAQKVSVGHPAGFTNGYEIIRGHLCQVGPGKGGGEK